MLINAGVERFVVAEMYNDELADSFIEEAGIEIELITPEEYWSNDA
jgi:deoxycytidylate deaminase